MTARTDLVEKYVRDTLHTPLHLSRWRGAADLPALLRKQYDYYLGHLLNAETLFVFTRQQSTPAAMAKQVLMMKRYWPSSVVVVADHADATWRNRMITKAIPFIVPGNQAYLPMLGVDLRERFKQPRSRDDALVPATQVAFLHIVLDSGEAAYTPTELSETLGYSKMTISRAFDQLEQLELANIARVGRQRLLTLAGDRRSIWSRAQPVLRSPIKKQVWVRKDGAGKIRALKAGLTALAAHSPLAAPAFTTLATVSDVITHLPTETASRHTDEEYVEENQTMCELWSYPPWLLSRGAYVDRFSLYLSLRGDQNERVQAALDRMMEEAW